MPTTVTAPTTSRTSRATADLVTPAEDTAPPLTPVAPAESPRFLDGEFRLRKILAGFLYPARDHFDEARRHLERLRFGRALCNATDACCEHRTPEVLEIEAADLVSHWHWLPDVDRAVMETQIESWLTMPLPLPSDAPLAMQEAAGGHRGCPFYLAAERRCGIAPWQPLQCRAYGLFNQPRADCSAALTATETPGRRQLLTYQTNPGNDRLSQGYAARAAELVTALLAACVALRYGVLSGYLPWLTYRLLCLGGVPAAQAQADAGAFVRPLTSYLVEPLWKRWAFAGARAAEALRTTEDDELAHDRKPLKWHQRIWGQDRLGLGRRPARGLHPALAQVLGVRPMTASSLPPLPSGLFAEGKS